MEYLGCLCVVAQQLSQSKGILLFASTPASFGTSLPSLFSQIPYSLPSPGAFKNLHFKKYERLSKAVKTS